MKYRQILLLGFLTYTSQVFSQGMLRCEDMAGKVIYVNDSCPPGTQATRQVHSAPTPNPSEQQAAQARAKEQSDELKKLQLAQEKEDKANRIAKALAEKAAATKKAACARKLNSWRQAERRADEAIGKAAHTKKQHAVFLGEAYEADCGKP
ncbi:MAG: DUF4124 domain-containing protein [Burkholderiaceae bacterium]|nr:DUF4124 domain-containing protein [Burkholderiaceae bacterium]